LFREHVQLNTASFSVTASIDSDLWRETAQIQGMPDRTGHVPDATAYATQPADADSWQARLRGRASPAAVTTSGQTSQQGNLT